MTRRISLADMRYWATSEHALPAASKRRAAEVTALIDVAEAARSYFAQSLPYMDDADADLASLHLREMLDRFDFEGQP